MGSDAPGARAAEPEDFMGRSRCVARLAGRTIDRVVAVLALPATAGAAGAATIDTTTTDPGDVFRFGPPDTATYGQTLLGLGGPDTVLDGFSLFLRTQFDGTDADPVNVKGYVAEWDGTKATTILFSSDVRQRARTAT
jgi:hypothetical protein